MTQGGWKAHSRLHDNKSQCNHLVSPLLVFLLEPWDSRPLILAPERFRLVWIGYRPIKVNSFMIICLAVRDILLEPSIPWQESSVAASVASAETIN